MTKCDICSGTEVFEGEGKLIKGLWICSWRCKNRAKEVGLITDRDIKESLT